MKYSDLPLKTIDELRNSNTYIICSEVITNEEDEVENINKCLLNAKQLASKEEVMSLTEQNSKLVNIINKLLQKNQELQKTIEEINNVNKDISLDDIQKQIDQMLIRLDNGLVEL